MNMEQADTILRNDSAHKLACTCYNHTRRIYILFYAFHNQHTAHQHPNQQGQS
jgi:hypothetical protein